MKRHRKLHSWEVSPDEAVKLQEQLVEKITLEPLNTNIRYVAGGDISFQKGGNKAAAGFVIYDIEKQESVEKVATVAPLRFPYIPGLLSFREMPPLLQAWEKLTGEPDVVMLDGHGVAHPRRFGLASHFGLWVDKPALGCAKNVLTGTFSKPENQKGQFAKLQAKDDIIGYVVRTRTGVKPVFVSAGHKIDHKQAVDVALRSSPRFKIPEPTRQADLLVNKYRRSQAFVNYKSI